MPEPTTPPPATPEPVIATDGQTWTRADDGVLVILLGRRSRTWVVAPAADPAAWYDVPLDEFATGYTWSACDHVAFCCASHDIHAMPHRGCVLR